MFLKPQRVNNELKSKDDNVSLKSCKRNGFSGFYCLTLKAEQSNTLKIVKRGLFEGCLLQEVHEDRKRNVSGRNRATTERRPRLNVHDYDTCDMNRQ